MSFFLPRRLMMPSLQHANNRMRSRNSSMNAMFITPFVRSFDEQSNSKSASNWACSDGSVFNNFSAFIVRKLPSSFLRRRKKKKKKKQFSSTIISLQKSPVFTYPLLILQKSKATVLYERAFSFKYFAYLLMNGDMSYAGKNAN